MPRPKEPAAGTASAQAQQEAISEGIDSYELPRNLVVRIARSGIPENAKMQKEVALSIVKATTVFINYLAATAHDVASSKQHKSISASDVLKGLELIDLGDLVEPLQRELHAYRETQKADKNKRGGGASTASAKGKAREADQTSVSAASARSRAKGKEKEREKGPTITIFPPQAHTAAAPAEEPDGDAELEEERYQNEDEEMLDEEGQDEEMEGVEEDGGEEDVDEEVEDVMAVEVEELARDARGLEDTMDEDD